MASFTADQVRVARNIVAIATKFRAASLCPVPVLAHLAVTKQESDWNDSVEGDASIGGSWGPYQIYQVAHPNTAYLATSPWADYAFYICMQPWTSAWNTYGANWDDPTQRGNILELFAPLAQGSIAWSQGLGAQRYAEALQMLELVS